MSLTSAPASASSWLARFERVSGGGAHAQTQGDVLRRWLPSESSSNEEDVGDVGIVNPEGIIRKAHELGITMSLSVDRILYAPKSRNPAAFRRAVPVTLEGADRIPPRIAG